MKNQRLSGLGNRSNQSGQALVEYILLLIISIVLVMGLMLQFFKPVQIFIKDYMGNYVDCLLATGELPSLNSGQSNLQDNSCSPDWERAVANANGDPDYFRRAATTGGPGGNGRGGGANGSGGPGSNGGKDGNGNVNGKGSGSDSGQAGAGTYAGSSSRSGRGRSSFNPRRSNQGADGAAGANDKSVVISLNEGTGSSRFFKIRTIASNQSTNKRAILDMGNMSEKEKEKLKAEPKGAPRVIASEGTVQKQNRKIIIKPQVEKPKVEKEEKAMSFGNYFRIFFMICIIILLVILLGGQALQISKGWEK